MRRLLLMGLGSLLAGCVAPTAPEAVAPVASPEALAARIDPAQLDRALLARAIFEETNRVRAKLGLPQFRYLPKLDEAADLEAAVGRVYQPPSHHNPFPMIGTPMARVQFVGLTPGRVAENIALLPVQETGGAVLITRDGRAQFVRPGTLEPAPAMTYRDFAAMVVDLWMNSPGHRANLVHPDLQYLGCSGQTNVSLAGIQQMFCVQVFFTPPSQPASRGS